MNCIVRAISAGLITAVMLIIIVLLINGQALADYVNDSRDACSDSVTTHCFTQGSIKHHDRQRF